MHSYVTMENEEYVAKQNSAHNRKNTVCTWERERERTEKPLSSEGLENVSTGTIITSVLSLSLCLSFTLSSCPYIIQFESSCPLWEHLCVSEWGRVHLSRFCVHNIQWLQKVFWSLHCLHILCCYFNFNWMCLLFFCISVYIQLPMIKWKGRVAT